MDDTVETLTIGVQADTAGFATSAATMQKALSDALGSGADKGASLIASSLQRAIKTGQLSFDDLKSTALSVLSDIAAKSVTAGLGALFGTSGGGTSGGLASTATGLLGALVGLPGRATGGPVSPGRAYMVGEQGPELFVPTSAGSVAAATPAGGGRAVQVAIHIAAPAGGEPQALARSSRQVARAVTRALAQAER
jgi:phage-related minor tail protein